ncbi:DUF1360 domain-containing protein [Streptomyces sp. NBC_01207]|uniref:DUF1360 domain-containing protein n=1 Tax=Streptomyces sp. NBC_01207 TaxID=2903772 RepID=UPI002E0FBB9D|nr:DUF1360 domain-containing protein [Streptomyces sp. NBC_01207]
MITIPELALLALAGYRATQLVVHDTILDPVRGRIEAAHEARPTSRLLTAVMMLLSCVYCVGWWVAGALLAAYLLATGQWDGTPLLVHGIEWLAVAGAAVFFNRIDDTLKDLT